MDLHQAAQAAFNIAASVSLPAALALFGWSLRQAKARWHFAMSQQTQDRVEAEISDVVTAGVGWGRAKLASGQMSLEHVTTGNQHIDQIAQAALNMLSDQAKDSGITTDDIARRIVGGLGHVLGEDASVPTIAAPDSSTVTAAPLVQKDATQKAAAEAALNPLAGLVTQFVPMAVAPEAFRGAGVPLAIPGAQLAAPPFPLT
jgi:hypothetical protein